MNRKLISGVLIGLILVCFICGTLGLFQSFENKRKDKNPEPTPEPGDYEISYIYFLEDIEQDVMPVNPEGDSLYEFSRFVCTNRVTGEWVDEDWNFVPEETADSTCKLYFVKNKYEVTFNLTNGVADANNKKYIDRETDGYFKIAAQEGFQYESHTCSDEKEAIWDEENSELVIKAIAKDVVCNIKFELKEYTLEVKVSEGTGAGKEVGNHGETVEAIVTPNDGYTDPTVKCTNNQKGTWGNNKLTIEKLTNNTVCTVSFFKEVQAETRFTMTIQGLSNASLSQGTPSMSILKGENLVWKIRTLSGYSFKSISCSNGVQASTNTEGDTTTVAINNVQKASTCTAVIEQD